MRCKPESLAMDVRGERNPNPLQWIRKVHVVLKLKGRDLQRDKVERAVALSRDKYCSVQHTLREDVEITTEIRMDAS
jgi:putative redox protein